MKPNKEPNITRRCLQLSKQFGISPTSKTTQNSTNFACYKTIFSHERVSEEEIPQLSLYQTEN